MKCNMEPKRPLFTEESPAGSTCAVPSTLALAAHTTWPPMSGTRRGRGATPAQVPQQEEGAEALRVVGEERGRGEGGGRRLQEGEAGRGPDPPLATAGTQTRMAAADENDLIQQSSQTNNSFEASRQDLLRPISWATAERACAESARRPEKAFWYLGDGFCPQPSRHRPCPVIPQCWPAPAKLPGGSGRLRVLTQALPLGR